MRSSGALAYALNPADSVHYLQRLLPLAYLAFVWGALFFASMS